MPTKFVFLLLPNIHILDLAGADQAIHEAIEYGADFEIVYCGLNRDITTTSGLPFGHVPHFTEISMQKGDFLMIPGSSFNYVTSSDFKKELPLFTWIQQAYAKGVSVCSICMGAFVLAESGLLHGKSCTTHFKKTKDLQNRYPSLRVIENILFTDQDNLYTSAGIVAGIDLTLHIIEKLKGSYFAHKVARELVIYHRRKGSDSQQSELMSFRNHIHSGIHQVQDHLVENIHIKSNLTALAEIAHMSERNLTRIFKKETGVTIHDYITTIRINKAKDLLKNPDLSKINVANLVGLESEKQLSRIMKI